MDVNSGLIVDCIIYIEGMPGRGPTGLHVACGTGTCLARPPGDRATTDQRLSTRRELSGWHTISIPLWNVKANNY